MSQARSGVGKSLSLPGGLGAAYLGFLLILEDDIFGPGRRLGEGCGGILGKLGVDLHDPWREVWACWVGGREQGRGWKAHSCPTKSGRAG